MQTFTPFPLRARGLVEQFDAAIKLYKQYFWVLLGWSAIVTGSGIVGAILPFGGFASLFLTPLAIGSVICCVAAAVRGQSVEFGQCWRFTQPRYWSVLGLHLLASFIGAMAIAIMVGAMVAITIGGVAAFGSSSGAVQVAMGIFAFLVFGTIGTIVGTVFLSWMGLVPIVVCMEDNKRGMPALGRAYEILRGHWLRVTTLMALVGLAMCALLLILASTAALLMGVSNIKQLMNGGGSGGSDVALIAGIIGFVGSYTLLMMLWTPLYYLILTVFYLDVRVRQEALDLEWTAHATAPSTLGPPPAAPPEAFGTNAYAPQAYAPDAYAPDAYTQPQQPEYSAPTPFTPQAPLQNVAPRYATQRFEEASENIPVAPDDFIEGQPLPAANQSAAGQPDDNSVIAPPVPGVSEPGVSTTSTPAPNPAASEPPRPQW
jgi:hypothetical protein